MKSKGFEGWYFKHQSGDKAIAFIPGKSENGAFVQMIFHGGSRQFDIQDLKIENGTIYAGKCIFSPENIKIDLPGVNGEAEYGELTKLKSDIMGPFRFFPMECRHGVISMNHTVNGQFNVEGEKINFEKGLGYIEKDSGISFPKSYIWLQCNDFKKPCSFMLSIAHIPFAGFSFTGCICAVIYEGHEYRMATYSGVRIHAADSHHICISQGKMFLEADIFQNECGYMLKSPVRGMMSGEVTESISVPVRVALWNDGRKIFDQKSRHASFEYMC